MTTAAIGGSSDTDPVTREVIYSGVRAVVQEMEVVIGRTAMSPIIKDKQDYFMGIYDAEGRMIHALTSYSGPSLANPILDRYAKQDIAPGDIFFYNDPYSTNGALQHQPDVVVIMPYHWSDGDLAGFVTAFGHFEDIGGLAGGEAMNARDIFHEGVAYPPMRVGREYEVDPAFMALLRRNSRFPEFVRGDWRALQAGARLGVDRMSALIGRWGDRAVASTAAWVIEDSAGRVRKVIQKHIPDGEYYAEGFLDATVVGRPKVKVAALLTKKGPDLILDLTGSEPQVDAPLNYLASLPVTQLLMLMQLTTLDEKLTPNQGSLSNITELIVPDGTVVSPRFPAPLNARSTPRAALIACLTSIMAQANDGWITASSPTYVICDFRFEGGHGYSETLGVGLGARPYGDGPDVIYGSAQRNYPIEQLEPKFPLRVEEYSIRRDTGGGGHYRGGCGVRRAIRVLADGWLSPRMANSVLAAPGVAGGFTGGLGKVSRVTEDGSEVSLSGTSRQVPFRRGDLIRLESAGGGGWGDPLTRPEGLVCRDVREGFVSEEQAASVYGVWLRNGEIDADATASGPRNGR
jgi:N-methylhydantoinase B